MPCYYLDFESVKTAVVFWDGVRPHEQIVTQYSLHICDSFDCTPRHIEYLASPEKDPRREFAEHLLEHLGTEGSIVVYSHFENTQLKGLEEKFLDLAPKIAACRERLFDLEKVFKSAVCHPDFCGKTSIKKTLPALVPKMTYSGMAVGNGDEAIVAFIKMARGLCNPSEIQTVRKNLLTYCHQDTLAMVELHRTVSSFL